MLWYGTWSYREPGPIVASWYISGVLQVFLVYTIVYTVVRLLYTILNTIVTCPYPMGYTGFLGTWHRMY